MRLLILLGGLLLLATGAIHAQEPLDSLSKKERRRAERAERLRQTDSYFVVEALGTFRRVQDQATSRHIYRGWGGGLGTGGYRVRGDHTHEFQARGGYNQLESGAFTRSHDFWGHFNYAYLYRVNKSAVNRLSVGGQADILAQVRSTPALDNSSLHWEVVGSLGLAARWQRSVRLPLLRTEVQAFAQLRAPLIAYVNRPGAPITVGDEQAQHISTIGRLRRLDVEMGFLFPVRRDNPNQYRLTYRWDLFRWRDNDYERVITGHHLLTIGLLVLMI